MTKLIRRPIAVTYSSWEAKQFRSEQFLQSIRRLFRGRSIHRHVHLSDMIHVSVIKEATKVELILLVVIQFKRKRVNMQLDHKSLKSRLDPICIITKPKPIWIQESTLLRVIKVINQRSHHILQILQTNLLRVSQTLFHLLIAVIYTKRYVTHRRNRRFRDSKAQIKHQA